MQIVRTNEAILSSLKQGVAAAALVQKPQRILHGRLKKISQYKKQEGHADTTTKQAFVPGHLSRQPLGPGQ